MPLTPVRRAGAISYSKQRDTLGFVGIDAADRTAYIRNAQQWPRSEAASMAETLSLQHIRMDWGRTMVDADIGRHVIGDLRRAGMAVDIITTGQSVTDGTLHDRLKKMPVKNMAEFVGKLKDGNRLKFPRPGMECRACNVICAPSPPSTSGASEQQQPKCPRCGGPVRDRLSPGIRALKAQLEMVKTHITEGGTAIHRVPGTKNHDDLFNALLIACFSAHRALERPGDAPFQPLRVGRMTGRPPAESSSSLAASKAEIERAASEAFASIPGGGYKVLYNTGGPKNRGRYHRL